MVYSRSTEYTDRAMTRSVKLSGDLVDFIDKHAEKGKEVPGCTAECIEICKSNAMRDLNDLRMLSRRCWLGEYFPAKVALRFENALSRHGYIQRFNELEKKSWMDKKDTKPPWVNAYFPLSTTIESMESACATYGILSALLLTMNVSTFCSMEIEEWGVFESGVAMERCNGTSLFRWSSGRPGETVEECVAALSAESEKWFVASNYGACLFLMLTLLLSSWLYIAFGVPGADRTRPDEVQAVVARFSGEFAVLNVLFLFSLGLSGTGFTQLTQIKIRSWNLVIFLSTIGIITFVCIGLLASWLIWEIWHAKGCLDEIRDMHSSIGKEDIKYEKADRAPVKKAAEASAQAPRRRDAEAQVPAEMASEQELAQGAVSSTVSLTEHAKGSVSSTISLTHALSA